MDGSAAGSLSDLRSDWINFITGEAGLTRFLSGFGDVAQAASPSALAPRDILDFLQLLSRSGANYSLLLQAILLTGRAVKFLRNQLPQLLRALNHEVGRTQDIVGPALKGKPSWGGTVLSRTAGRIRPYEFVARRPERSADLPENRLLKLLLTQIIRAVHLLERGGASGAMAKELRVIKAECHSALRSGALQNVIVPKVVTSVMRMRARRARNPYYRVAAEIQLMLEQTSNATRRKNWAAALALLKHGWLEPVNDDDVFELFTLAMLIRTIERLSGCGPPSGIALLTGDRSWIATFNRTDLQVAIYFDQSPATQLGSASEYSAIVAAYTGVTGNARRPDITVVVDRASGERDVVLIECKNTAASSYVSDSIYKVFGYLQDFKALWVGRVQVVRAILVVPDRVETKDASKVAGHSVRLVSGTDRENFEDLILGAIG